MAAPITHGIVLSRGGVSFQFPVNTDNLRIARGRDVHTIDIVSFREVARPGLRKLKRINFSSFLPKTYDPSYCHYTPIPAPDDIVFIIEEWLKTGAPAFMSVTGTPVGIWVLIDAFNTEERAGHPGDIFYEFSAVEFVDLRIDVSDPVPWPAPPRPPDATAGPQPGQQYEVQSGDTLWTIAKQFYGNGSLYSVIHDANREVIGSNPNVITPGMILVIPVV